MSARGGRNQARSVSAGARRVWERLEPVHRRIRARFTVDTRALAAARIALALVLLLDLVHRSQDMVLFYTDRGAYPVAAYEVTYTQYTGYSLHALSGDLWFQQLLFFIAGLFALAFLAGYRTRLVGFVSFLFLFSLHARNPGVLNGGDRLLRVLLLVALLAPLGERWSLDALRRGSARKRVASVGTAVLLLQPVVVFTSNAILKHAGENWYAGDGLEIAMLNDSMRFYLGNVVVEYPALMTVLNYAWVGMIAGSALFLLGTVGRARALAALAYTGAFVGMLTTMAVGWFPLILIAAILPFFPTSFWDALAARVPTTWHDWLPDRDDLGPLGRPPLERRLLVWLRERGHTGVAAVPRSLLTVVSVLVLVWILLFAASDVTGRDVPDRIDYDHLDQQSWGLYAPDPSEGYVWYVVEAEFPDGTAIDPVAGGAVNFDRPPDGSAAYDNFRHRKFMRLVWSSSQGHTTRRIVNGYAEWACRQAHDARDGRAERITVYRFYQASPLDGEYEESERWTVVERSCAAG